MKIRLFLASALGAGLIPVAPGTFGTLIGALSFWLLPEKYVLVFFLLFFIASFFIVSKTQQDLSEKDDRRIVLDEAAAIWLIFSLIPRKIEFQVLAFALFRFLDVSKPLGIKKIQNLPGAWGVMMDDILAGIYTVLCIGALLFLGRVL